MKRSICLSCGKPYVQYGHEHTCPECDEAEDGADEQAWLLDRDKRIARELDDPALKERIEQAIKRTRPDSGKPPDPNEPTPDEPKP